MRRGARSDDCTAVDARVIERRRGKRRRTLVVTDLSGRQIGTYDVRTGSEYVFDARDLPRFQAPISAHLRDIPRQPEPEQARPPAPAPGPSLFARVPAQSVLEALFACQDARPARARWQRLLGSSPLATKSRPWLLGALGELRIARQLEKLGTGWYVLHAVPLGNGTRDVDHVVIGPPGVFTLNTKNHTGQRIWIAGRKLMVGGTFVPHIPVAEDEAARASARLSRAVGHTVPVTATIALTGAKEITVKERPATVLLATERSLVRTLRKRPPVWPAAHVDRVAASAADPRTWQDTPVAPCDGQALTRRFQALRAEIRSAQRVRLLWLAGALIAAMVVLPQLG